MVLSQVPETVEFAEAEAQTDNNFNFIFIDAKTFYLGPTELLLTNFLEKQWGALGKLNIIFYIHKKHPIIIHIVIVIFSYLITRIL